MCLCTSENGPVKARPRSLARSGCARRCALFFRPTFAIPSQGTDRTSPRLGTHDDHRLTTLLICGRSHLCRRPGIGPGTQPAANSNHAPRLECAGSEPDRKAEPVERRHSSERGGPGHREAVTQGGRSERGAAARDFRRRFRAAAKMTARFLRLVPGSKWTGNARPEPSVAILAVRPEHSFRLRGHPNGRIGLTPANASERHSLGGR